MFSSSSARSDPHHTGDLGNIEADESGNATHEVENKDLTVGKGERSIVGRAVVVHEKADDLKSQPAGDAGSRVACGVIKLDE
jgi:Cu-Zn family superoxide dismutase